MAKEKDSATAQVATNTKKRLGQFEVYSRFPKSRWNQLPARMTLTVIFKNTRRGWTFVKEGSKKYVNVMSLEGEMCGKKAVIWLSPNGAGVGEYK